MDARHQALKGTLRLDARFSASPYDDHYQMAFLHCVDKHTGYVFSLSRFPNESQIEVMVLDQLNQKVLNLSVELVGSVLDVKLTDDLARRLDGFTRYQVSLEPERPTQLLQLHESLNKIFDGKGGFTIRDAA